MTNEQKFIEIFGIDMGEECTDSDICDYREMVYVRDVVKKRIIIIDVNNLNGSDLLR